ncbi:hypothetical protein [Pigmentiphaga sp.]|uniref:hypothetical protein n=1 Tax=Pigmentiphaga sp. TaxID=1977564 RepID=UPI00128DE943|nr:hypothetical protein [Pigmentiphaga sp.]MPS26073.1 hypothetical protein [Alcaligenaceae bacterium SAGV5]MPS53048.1 hypothetical protein [Alcaligenaceae bacterium SAGV3]
MRFAHILSPWGAKPARVPREQLQSYRLTVFSASPRLDRLRQHLHAELSARDLRISQMRVASAASDDDTHWMSVTLHCAPHLRGALNSVALGLGRYPDVQRVHYEQLQ